MPPNGTHSSSQRIDSTPIPELSVVIASVNGWDLLRPTLRSIDALPERARIEVVVVEAVGGATRENARNHEPPVVLIESRRLPIPRLRYQGVIGSRGALVAILEDHAEVSADWARSVLEAHRSSWGAVGGAVENGGVGLVDWAVFFCEYAPYMNPVAQGETDDLPGNNIAYKRPHLLGHAHLLDDGKWESWINDRLRRDGVPIASDRRMVVRHIKPFRLGYFLRQRFHFARSYAGMRRADQSYTKRWVYGIGSLALPLILLVRVTRTVLGKRRQLGRFAICLPLVTLFFVVGAFGEMIGYLLGPGASLDKVE